MLLAKALTMGGVRSQLDRLYELEKFIVVVVLFIT